MISDGSRDIEDWSNFKCILQLLKKKKNKYFSQYYYLLSFWSNIYSLGKHKKRIF